jgi:hypothetical protein
MYSSARRKRLARLISYQKKNSRHVLSEIPTFDSLAWFRVIVLLQKVPKILERIREACLVLIARATSLISLGQTGSLSDLYTFDTVASLAHTVKTLQKTGQKVSTLFLDIKCGFDNMD